MRSFSIALSLTVLATLSARCDLTIVQQIEGAPASPGKSKAPDEMVIRIKGDKARIDSSPQVTTIIDGKSGDILNVMNDQKKFLRVSGEQVRGVAETAARFITKTESTEKPKLVPTGKKETINGYETEEYVTDTPQFQAHYFIAPNFPDGASIMKQMQKITPQGWGLGEASLPDYASFPGVPVRTRMKIGGKEIVSTLISVKSDPLPEADFLPPTGFEEMKMPDLGKMFGPKSESKIKPPKP